MKRKKQLFLAVSLATCFTLAGCMNPPMPKDAYIKGMNIIEDATTYQKTSTVNIEAETKGIWDTNQVVLFELLNESTLEAVTVTDETKEQSETTLRLSGGFDYVPIDTTLRLFFDDNKQKTYIEGEGLLMTFAPYATLSPALKDTWIEVGTKKDTTINAGILQHLLQVDFASVWSNIPAEKFIRSEVPIADKQTGIRDVVTLSLQQIDLQQLLPSTDQLSNKLTFERITFTLFLDRKGKVVKEKIETKFTHKNTQQELVVHAAVLSSYDLFNEAVPLSAAPKAQDIRSFDALFEPETKTEKLE